MPRPQISAVLALLLALCHPVPVLAQDGRPAPVIDPRADPRSSSWTEEKCRRYRSLWSQALARRGTRGLGPDFMERHQAFMDSGCTARADVCPRSAEELDLANIMVMAAMNAGTASTFLPFACRR
ncbi:MAG TPA: hypothetical protein VIL09_17695 [Microvirga sp.]|jgi:cytochrome P450